MAMRSKLFVPGSRPDFFAKALAGPADAISFDLEDAVLEERKDAARSAVGRFLREECGATDKTLIVRINGLSTKHYIQDVDEVLVQRLDAVNLPKVESPADIHVVAELLAKLESTRRIDHQVGILANIESPRGLRNAATIAAASERVIGLQLGFGDLFEPLGIDRGNAAAVAQVQLLVRIAAGEAGVGAYDGAYVNVHDQKGFEVEAACAASLGFAGKSCIHPSQVPLANAAFVPGEARLREARRIVEAWELARRHGQGAVVIDGRMIDRPNLRHATRLIELAEQALAGTGSTRKIS